MYEWWKDPRLDDEGTYDYLIEELPTDSHEWNTDRYTCRCESCGRQTHISVTDTHYFYCWDGWDSMSYTECWKCVLKAKTHRMMGKLYPVKMHRRYKVCKRKGLKPKDYMCEEWLWNGAILK